MSYTIIYDPVTETYDEKIARLSGTAFSTSILAHWGLAANTNVGQYYDSINVACNNIISGYGSTEALNGAGVLTRTFPSQTDADSANAAVDAYKANLTTANISYTVSGNVITAPVTFIQYVDQYHGNANVSLSA